MTKILCTQYMGKILYVTQPLWSRQQIEWSMKKTVRYIGRMIGFYQSKQKILTNGLVK